MSQEVPEQHDVPDLSFGFVKNQPRVLKEVQLLYLSLDLYPGPYGSVPEVAGEGDS